MGTASGCSGDAEAPSRTRLYSATKIPPKNRKWPARPESTLDDVFPPDYIREYTEKSLDEPRRLDDRPAAVPCVERHVGRRRALAARGVALKDEGLVRAIGISVNRWQPANVLRALDTGLIDAVQVVYNVLRSESRRRAVPRMPRAEHRGHRARAVRRGQPHRHADGRPRWPEGTFATSTSRPRICRRRSSASNAAADRAGGHDDAGACAAAHPAAPGRQHGHPRHAQRDTWSRTSPPATARSSRPTLWQSLSVTDGIARSISSERANRRLEVAQNKELAL